MIKGKCKRKGCMYREREGMGDFILITGRPRGCDIENCDQYIKGPKAMPKSEWGGQGGSEDE